jgi:hypothetical protein
MMSEQRKPRGRRDRALRVAVGTLALVALCLGARAGWAAHERARLRTEAHRGLEGTWADDSGQDVSYQFREDGKFLVRQS